MTADRLAADAEDGSVATAETDHSSSDIVDGGGGASTGLSRPTAACHQCQNTKHFYCAWHTPSTRPANAGPNTASRNRRGNSATSDKNTTGAAVGRCWCSITIFSITDARDDALPTPCLAHALTRSTGTEAESEGAFPEAVGTHMSTQTGLSPTTSRQGPPDAGLEYYTSKSCIRRKGYAALLAKSCRSSDSKTHVPPERLSQFGPYPSCNTKQRL